MDKFSITMILGGIAVFIFGMSRLEESLRALAGRPFKKFLQRQTENKFRAILAGTAITGVLQGSSVVMLMILSFVGAGIMSLRNALGVMLGSNLGSTLNNWLVAWIGFRLNLETFSYPLLAIALITMLFRSPKAKAVTDFLFGFALLFIGLEWMKSSVSQLVQSFDLSPYLQFHPYWFIVVGFLITSLVQSSSATMAIALSALFNNAITFEVATCLVLGAELGTTVKLLIGSMGGIPDKKRLALANFVFNFVSLILAAAFLGPLITFVRDTLAINDSLVALVSFQSLINLAGIILFYPFMGAFASFLEKRYQEEGDEQTTRFLKTSAQPFAEHSLPLARQETMRLFRHATRFNRSVLGINGHEPSGWRASWRSLVNGNGSVDDAYRDLKRLQGEILEYLASLNTTDMDETEAEYSAKLLTVSRDIIHASKNIKDIAHNWHDIETSSNDHLHSIYLRIKQEEGSLLQELEQLLLSEQGSSLQEKLESLLEQNRTRHRESIERVMTLLKADSVSELDASTLLNVYREIYSSHKALLASLGSLHTMPDRL